MRSNGAVHIGNDTFLAVTRDVTDSAFLFSSSFPPGEQLAKLPLSRKTRFHPHASLTCGETERHYHAEPSAGAGQSAEVCSKTEAAVSAAPTPLFRHSAHASPDGRKIAFISNVRRHHYIVDISVVPASVCEVEMPEVVQSVCWHAAAHHTLCVLFISGYLAIYNTEESHLGVIVPQHRRIALRPIMERSLADAELHAHVFPSSLSSTAVTAYPAKGAAAPDKEPQSTSAKALEGEVSTTGLSSARPARVATAAAAASFRTPTPHDGGTIVAASCIARSPDHAAAERTSRKEIMPVSDADEFAWEGAASPPLTPTPAALLTPHLDLVDMYALPPTESIPVILLLLSRRGDVYAMHLGDDCLPVVATATAIDDGRIRTYKEEALRRAEVAMAPLNVEVHHLICGDKAGVDEDVALAVGGCLVDREAGTHAVFFCTANGLVKGAWVSEPDLLARHRVAHVRAVGLPNISFTLHLSDSLGVRDSLSPAVPSTTHGVSMSLAQNVCVVRNGRTGEKTFVAAFPRWDRRRQGWACWRPACFDAQERTREEAALPLLSTGVSPPSPIVLRLPYDTSGASIALGCTELALVPEVATMDGPCARRNIVTMRLAALLRSALYARCGKLRLHPSAGAGALSRLRDPQPAVLGLLNAVPECHRRWLRGVPEEEMSAATLDLVRRVEQLSCDVSRREMVQVQRRQRLMAKLAGLESRVADMGGTLAKWQQTILDGIAHRRGGEAFRTANERLGEVFAMLNELEQQLSSARV
ncbi:hypothetical protein JIQ42_04875 [Leishmania sp. Namibia]|uniref:hypothetical protein n=1 Tax=Leishmania sp. Namibia TaxID=2802991 RepID=UPI001B455F96|nr:hypothetical protein JIQ42_04875 [Leishmania sp. Namibia]